MRVEYRDDCYEVTGGSTARDTILKLGLDPESVLVVQNGQLVDDSAILRESDEVKLVAVISGG